MQEACFSFAAFHLFEGSSSKMQRPCRAEIAKYRLQNGSLILTSLAIPRDGNLDAKTGQMRTQTALLRRARERRKEQRPHSIVCEVQGAHWPRAFRQLMLTGGVGAIVNAPQTAGDP
jgi:hypothetical protein